MHVIGELNSLSLGKNQSMREPWRLACLSDFRVNHKSESEYTFVESGQLFPEVVWAPIEKTEACKRNDEFYGQGRAWHLTRVRTHSVPVMIFSLPPTAGL